MASRPLYEKMPTSKRGALEWLTSDRHPRLPNEEKNERAETRDESDERGTFVEIVKRSRCAASSAGRRGFEDALRSNNKTFLTVYDRMMTREQGCGEVAPAHLKLEALHAINYMVKRMVWVLRVPDFNLHFDINDAVSYLSNEILRLNFFNLDINSDIDINYAASYLSFSTFECKVEWMRASFVIYRDDEGSKVSVRNRTPGSYLPSFSTSTVHGWQVVAKFYCDVALLRILETPKQTIAPTP
ncbi:hypothetical protein BGW80DRAFT_1451035 [Lactifluus volemus]|nr:hypothetical protein BGW80DRAFT_1451035 [Lactifluus volemus]